MDFGNNYESYNEDINRVPPNEKETWKDINAQTAQERELEKQGIIGDAEYYLKKTFDSLMEGKTPPIEDAMFLVQPSIDYFSARIHPENPEQAREMLTAEMIRSSPEYDAYLESTKKQSQSAQQSNAADNKSDSVDISQEFKPLVANEQDNRARSESAANENKTDKENATGTDPKLDPLAIAVQAGATAQELDRNTLAADKADATKVNSNTVKPEKPSAIEESFASMVERNNSSTETIVLVGDPEVKKRFILELEAKGLIHNIKGERTIVASNETVAKLWHEAAEKVDKIRGGTGEDSVSAKTLAKFRFQGEATGVLGNTIGKIPGLQRNHRVTVLGAGDAKVLKEQEDSVNKFLASVEKLSGKSTSKENDNTTVIDVKLRDAISVADSKVIPYEKSVAAEKEKKFNKDSSADKSTEVKSESQEDSFAAKLKSQVTRPELLLRKSGEDRKSVAEVTIQEVSEKLKNNLENVPEKDKATLLVAFAAMAEKLDALKKEADTSGQIRSAAIASSTFKKSTAENESPAKLLEKQLVTEVAKNPGMAIELKDTLTDFQKAGVVSEAQAAKIGALLDTTAMAAAELTTSPESNKAQGITAPSAEATSAPATSKASEASSNASDGLNVLGGSYGEITPESNKAQGIAAPSAEATSAPATSKASEASSNASDGLNVLGGSYGEITPESNKAQGITAPSAEAINAPTANKIGDLVEPTLSDSPSISLPEKVSNIFHNGPAELKQEDASSLLADLEGRRGLPLNRVDASEGIKPGETVERLSGILTGIENGNFDEATKAQAKSLKGDIGRWDTEAEKLKSTTTETLGDARAGVRFLGESWWNEPVKTKEATNSDPLKEALRSADSIAVAKKEPYTKDTSTAAASEKQSPAKEPELTSVKKETAQSKEPTSVKAPLAELKQFSDTARPEPTTDSFTQKQTESQVAKLSAAFANPAGTFITRTEKWNEAKITDTAKLASNLNTDAVRKLPAEKITEVAAFTAWLDKSAAEGRLPGLSGEKGAQLREQLSTKAMELVEIAKERGGPITETIQKNLTKSDNMLNSMETHTKLQSSAEQSKNKFKGLAAMSSDFSDIKDEKKSTVAAEDVKSNGLPYGGVQKNNEAQGIATAQESLVVFDKGSISEASVKNILKNAKSLTPENLQSLDPTTKAKATVALNEIRESVKDGTLLGPVEFMSKSMQSNFSNLENAVDTLVSAYRKSPETSEAMSKAIVALDDKLGGGDKSMPASKEQGANAANTQGGYTNVRSR